MSDQSLYLDLPFTDVFLKLVPRWGELEIAAQVACLAGAIAVPLALVFWLYRYEMRLVKRPAALTLLSLRCGVVLFLWLIFCFQPVLTSVVTRETPTRVAIGLDLSGSMTATDPQRPTVDKLRLARALNLELPGGTDTRKQLDAWIDQLDKKKDAREDDINWVGDDELASDGAGRATLIAERTALFRQICTDVDRMTRLEIGLRLLGNDGGKLVRSILDKHQVELIGFAEKTLELTPDKASQILEVVQALKPRQKKSWELKPEQVSRLFDLSDKGLNDFKKEINALVSARKEDRRDLQSADLDDLLTRLDKNGAEGKEKTGKAKKQLLAKEPETTDLDLVLERGLKPAGKTQGRLTGIVLLSDGRHNASSSPGKSAERLGKRNVSVYPVVLGTATPRPTVSIAEIQAPPSASAENVNATIRVRFKAAGLSPQDIVVSLDRADPAEGLAKVAPAVIAHNGVDQYYERSFVVAMDPDGKPRQRFIVSIKPAVKPSSGLLTQQVTIKMDDSKPKVLVVDGEGRWEYHYLATALARDPGLELQRVLFDPPLRRSGISERDLTKMGNPQRHLPEGEDALGDFQCIVLGDAGPDHLPLKDRARLEQFVAKHGGTLVVVAGKRFMPLAYQEAAGAGEKSEEADPLLKLLPVEDMKVVAPEEGFAVTLTREGKSAPFMRMEADTAESEQRWSELPPHYWGVIGKAKPAATVLAYFAGPGKARLIKEDGDDAPNLSREQGLIVRHHYGRGQVLFVGLDSTWRWRYRVGDTYHHRFWGQVIRWAAADYIRFGTDKPVYQEGQDVQVSLSLDEKELQALPGDAELKTRIIMEGEPGREERMVAVAPLTSTEGMRVLKGHVRGLPAGQYRIELIPPDPSLSFKLGSQASSSFQITPRDNREMDRLETDEDQLRALARESGNQHGLFTPVNAGELVALLNDRAITFTERYERGLWQEWGTLVFFLLLVTAEWVGRKWAGLP